MMEGIRKPDLVIYLMAEGSVSGRSDFGDERYETVEIQRKIQRNFDEIFANETYSKILKIDSCKEIMVISQEICEFVKKLI
jgi:thymidylate kinase